jgi:hypothetical protein
VDEKFSGGDQLAKLSKGSVVDVLSKRKDRRKIAYAIGGRPFIGWIDEASLGECASDDNENDDTPTTDHGGVSILPNDGTSAADLEVFDGCGLEGDAKKQSVQQLNDFKSRFTAPKASDFDPKVTLAAILAPGDDQNRWDMKKAAEITGFVFDAKVGGVETANCHAKDPEHRDTHIEITLDQNDTAETRRVIVEVTPRIRAVMARQGVDWSTNAIKANFVGHRVKVRGWMLFDEEHAGQSENTAPRGPTNWRATAWEIHPVTSIEMVGH